MPDSTAHSVPAETLLDIKGLSKHFPVSSRKLFEKKRILKAVEDVSFSIQKGETFGLVGESGCGKTTVGRCIIRLYDPTAGEIHYQGQNIAGWDQKQLFPLRRDMQLIFQDPYTSLDPRMTVGQIVAAPLEVHKITASGAESEERIKELLHLVGLRPEYINRYPHEFSGGQRQRIGIARALASNPKFIICDEPISALDVSIQAQIVNILERFQEEMDLTYLFISHDLSMVRHISQKVGVMYMGRLVEMAPVEELFGNIHHPYTMALLSAVPVADPIQAAASQRIVLDGDVPTPIDPPPGCAFRGRCAYAKPVCAEEAPPLLERESGHFVACHVIL